MKNLVLVEASGKTDRIQMLLKDIGLRADVMATVGHIADNPRSLHPICLDKNLVETRYQIKDDRRALVEKIKRSAADADCIYLAMDDDQEGHVIAFDVARQLAGVAAPLLRVHLRSISAPELRKAFADAKVEDLAAAAAKGMCRRIVDRAIGSTFTDYSDASAVAVGRVQTSLLATIAQQRLPIGEYTFAAKAADGAVFYAQVPVYDASEIPGMKALELQLKSGQGAVKSVSETIEASALPWTYEDVVAETSLRLRIGAEQAADAFQTAYVKGLVSYPRTRSDGFTPDAVETAIALAKQNRCHFDSGLLPMERAGRGAHEAPRPVDDEMLLGSPLGLLSAAEAVAVLIARNVVECGQAVTKRKMKIEIGGDEIDFTYASKPSMRSWKDKSIETGYSELPVEYSMLRLMARNDIGRPSTIVGHATRFLQRELISGGGMNHDLTDKGRLWLDHGLAAGINEKTASRIEAAIENAAGSPSGMAKQVLKEVGLLDAIEKQAFERPLNEKQNSASLSM